MTTIYHPECKELFGTIKEIDNSNFPGQKGNFEVTTCMGYQDWLDSFEEAKKYIEADLRYEYSGRGSEDRANYRAYAQAERFACGNY